MWKKKNNQYKKGGKDVWKTDLFSKWQSDLPAKRQSSSKQKGMMTASSNLYTLVVGIYSMPWMSNGLVRSKRRRETTPRHNGLLEKVYVVTWSIWSHFQFINAIWRHFSIKLDIWVIWHNFCVLNSIIRDCEISLLMVHL